MMILFFVLIFFCFRSFTIPVNPVAYYPFYNGNCIDESGNNHTCTFSADIIGSTDMFGNEDQSVLLQGSQQEDYVLLPDSDDFRFTNEFSFAGWFFFMDLTNDQHLLSTGCGGPSPYGHDYYIRYSGNQFWFRLNDAASSDVIYPNAIPSVNKWSHVAATYNVLSGSKLYLNGTVVASGTSYTQQINTGHGFAAIGMNGRFFCEPVTLTSFKGKIDEVYLYSRELIESEIYDIYQSYSPTIPSIYYGLVAHYPFNGNADDMGVNGNHGTVYGATLTDDKFGNTNSAYFFDGNDYITSNDLGLPSGSEPRSVSTWINLSAYTSPIEIILYGSPIGFQAYYFSVDDTQDCRNGGPAVPKIIVGTWGGGTNVCGSTDLNDGSWHLVVATFDGTNHRVYVDGQLEGVGEVFTSTTLSSTLNIGRYDSGNYFRGIIDDLRIYNRALSDADVEELYNYYLEEPLWDKIPFDQIVEYGSSLSYIVNASSSNGIVYYGVNDTINFEIDASGQLTNNTILEIGTYIIRLNASDGIFEIYEVISITIQDTIAPTWDPTPVDQTVECKDPFSYIVTASDLRTVLYSVNDTTNFAIDDVNGILTNNTVLVVGTYFIVLSATDVTNVISALIKVTVEDIYAPEWIVPPVDQFIRVCDRLEAVFLANDCSETVLYSVDDDTNFTISVDGVLTNNTILSLGSYPLLITISDGINSDSIAIAVYVQVSTPYWVVEPSNQIVEFGFPFIYIVEASDCEEITYLVGDTINFAMDPTDGILTNRTSSLPSGDYVVQIFANSNINTISSLIVVTVQDTILPVWQTVPENQVLEYGDPFSYTVTALDLNTITYSLSNNFHFSIDSNGEIKNNSLVDVGIYAIEIFADDGTNQISSSITITVEDSVPPIWNTIPHDQTIEFGDHFSYTVSASDLRDVFYLVNDTINFDMDFKSGELISRGILPIGYYNLKVYATDLLNTISLRIIVDVEDTTAPSWEIPVVDQTVEYGDKFHYTIIASDLQTVSYSVNDTKNFDMDSVTGELTNKIDLSVGTYTVQLLADDGLNSISAVIDIIVEDTIAPIWDEVPSNQLVELGDPLSYIVSASDLRSVTYSCDDIVNFNMDSEAGELTNLVDLSLGTYTLELTASDGFNSISVFIDVIVQDSSFPSWDEVPSDQFVEFGDSLSYTVSASDIRNVTYSCDDLVNFNMDSLTGELTNKIPLSFGTYTVQLSADDGLNSISAVIDIIVEDTIAPIWDEVPSNQLVELGDPLSYIVSASDLRTVSYSCDDVMNFNMDSLTGELTNLVDLSLGNYTVELTASDGFNSISVFIDVIVQDSSFPSWDEVPSDQFVEFGDSLSYTVSASDLRSIYYSCDDTVNFNMDSETGELTNLVDLSLGTYTLELSASDDVNTISETIDVVVQDTVAPVWDPIPTDHTLTNVEDFYYHVHAVDVTQISYSVDDRTNFEMNSISGILKNLAPLSGTYNLVVSASDGTNSIDAEITITVEETASATQDLITTAVPLSVVIVVILIACIILAFIAIIASIGWINQHRKRSLKSMKPVEVEMEEDLSKKEADDTPKLEVEKEEKKEEEKEVEKVEEKKEEKREEKKEEKSEESSDNDSSSDESD